MKKTLSCLILSAVCLSASLVFLGGRTVETRAEEQGNYLSYNFEDNRIFDNSGSGTAKLINVETCPEGVYEGNKAMEVSGIWARQTFNSGKQYSDMLVDGDFYEIDMFAKKATEGNFSVVCQLGFWGEKPDVGWKSSSTRIYATPYYSLPDNEWHELKYKFAVYGDGMKMYLYHNKGKANVFEEVSDLSGYFVTDQVIIDVGATNGKKVYIDNLSFKKSSVYKDAVITLNGDGASSATVKVFDGDNELNPQPAQTRVGNTIALSDLEFSSLSQAYTLKVYKGDEVVGSQYVSFAKNTTNCWMDKYDATLNLYDEFYNPIVDSIVMVDNIKSAQYITKNNNGQVTISNLTRTMDVKITAEGFVTKNVEISYDKPTQDVFLKTKNEVVEYGSNLTPQGSMENGFIFQSSSGQSYSFITDEQVSGDYSLEVNSSASDSYFNYRVKDALVPDGTTFRIIYQAKAKQDNVSIRNGVQYIGNGNNVDKGGSVYPTKLFKTEPITISKNWQTISYTTSLIFNEAESMIYTSLNGGEYLPHDETSSNVAAADFMFSIVNDSATVYIDNYSVFEVYEAIVRVKDTDGNSSTNATFEIKSPLGEKQEYTPRYDSELEAYIFEGMYGETEIYAKTPEKTYPVCEVSKGSREITINEPYDIVVTLKTPKGRLISGAKVSARIGITTKGVFTEISEGVYELKNMMDTYSVVATKDGYTFKTEIKVNANKCVFTMIGEPDEPEEDLPDSGDGATPSGCGGSVVAGASIVLVALPIAAIVASVRKRKE